MSQEEIINTVEGVGVGVDRVSEAMEVCEEEKVKKDVVVEAEKPSSAPPSVGFSELFRFSDGLDYILMTIGTIGAIIHGCSLLLFLRFFADLVNSFGANANDVDKMMDEVLKFLSKLGPADMAGEIGVMFNIPQPFTVRSKRLSQVIRISHQNFKQIVQPYAEEGRTIISNFVEYLKNLKVELVEEIPFIKDLLDGLNSTNTVPSELTQNHEAPKSNCDEDANIEGSLMTSATPSLPIRLVIHGRHPDEANTMENTNGKLIHLPNSREELLTLSEKKFGRRGSKILMADGSEVEELNALRENDHLFIC